MVKHGLVAPSAHLVESHAIDDQFPQDDPENDEVALDDFYTDDEQPSVPASTSVSVSASASTPAPPPPPPSGDHAEGPPTRSPTPTGVQTPPQSPSPPQDHHDLPDFDSPVQEETLPQYQATTSSSPVASANPDSSTEPKAAGETEVDVAHVAPEDPKGKGTGRERRDEEVLDGREAHRQPTPLPRSPNPPQRASQDGLTGPSSKHPHANADETVDLDAWMYDLDEQTWDDVHGVKGPSYEDDEALARAIAMESEWNELEVMAYGGRLGGMHGEERNVARARDSGANLDARREAVRTEWDVEIDEDMEIAMAVAAIDCAERERLTREQEELEERLLVEAETRADDDPNGGLEDDGTFVECGCCFSTYPLERMTSSDRKTMTSGACTRRVATRPSPSPSCDGSSQLNCFSLYERLKQQKELKEAALEGLEVCPFCDWGCVLEASKEEYPIFLCGNWECAKSSCRLCRKETHAQRTCLGVEEDRHIGGRLAIEEAMTEGVARLV
ncbi:hypothetical protein FA13DRAFT_132246 [Coprinellus micaceus]|uniref:RING-type domain-containing protein n=1 Tax=Coprinellus micaceus TaxID=71717 RepID=A0A4Y7SHS7_COPMI|nr:hypothetical protein FA13DRAFT_132246 [Coprinellus micaceus]